MKPSKSFFVVGLALASLSFPFSAGAQQNSTSSVATAPIGAVVEDVSFADYLVLLKSYDRQLFQYGKVRLTADGKQMLDDLAAALRNVDYRVIDITGHADPTGPASTNQRLAKERATAVKSYLTKHGINAEQIFTDAQPIQVFGKCVIRQGDALKKCLAPDRSAEVKVLAKAVVEQRTIDAVFDRIEPAQAR